MKYIHTIFLLGFPLFIEYQVVNLHSLHLSFSDNFAVLQPSSFYLVIQTFNGIQIQVQLVPVMQVSVSLDPEYQGNACGKSLSMSFYVGL